MVYRTHLTLTLQSHICWSRLHIQIYAVSAAKRFRLLSLCLLSLSIHAYPINRYRKVPAQTSADSNPCNRRDGTHNASYATCGQSSTASCPLISPRKLNKYCLADDKTQSLNQTEVDVRRAELWEKCSIVGCGFLYSSVASHELLAVWAAGLSHVICKSSYQRVNNLHLLVCFAN